MTHDESPLVAVYDQDGIPTTAKYKILEKKNNIVRLIDTTTDDKLRIHVSRVATEPLSVERREKLSKKAEKSEKPEKEGKMEKSEKKIEKSLEDFNVMAFVKEHGGEHWIRGEDGSTKFDHPEYRLITHAVMNEKDGHYYIINTYEKNGVSSLGRNGKGVTQYPLKGHQVTYTVSQTAKKVDSRGEEKIRKGAKSADDVRKHWQKSGYVKR